MLQQTQVARAVPAWERLLSDLPDPRAAAVAGQAELIRRWEGLGYNRRAVNLHRASVAIVEHHDGAVPQSLPALRELPGVGPYTARAVLAFAYEQDVAVVDTNVARILSRAIMGSPVPASALQRIADGLVTPGDGWRHNQAMLDHGALVCTARSPSCETCSVRRSCAWRRSGSSTPDPSRRPAGTSRPHARFEGSSRQARGAILSGLRRGPMGAAELRQLREDLGADRVDRALDALIAEGAVARTDGALGLADA